jgi:hypothetical protein
MDTFPLQGDPLPKGKAGWLLFFDELNSADRSVQKAAYKIFLDRKVGDTPLHKNVAMMAAGNLETDNAIVEEMSTALKSRLVHLRLRSDLEGFTAYMSKQGWDHRIISFNRFTPDLMNNFNPDAEGGEDTFACERTWEFVNKMLNKGLDVNSRAAQVILSGIVGQGAATVFLGYLRVFAGLPTISQILSAPLTTLMPDAPDARYALTGCLAQHINEDNADAIMDYMERLPMEFQIISLREMTRRGAGIKSHKRITDWVVKNRVELF